jgi:hypothetical protein
MATSLDAPLLGDLTDVNRRVALIEKKLTAAPPPWLTITVSALALVVSAAGAIRSYTYDSSSATREIHAKFLEQLGQLIQLREHAFELSRSPDPSGQIMATQFLNARRDVALLVAANLAAQAEGVLSTPEHILLGLEYASAAQFENAEPQFRKAISKAGSPSDTALAKGKLAELLFWPGPRSDIDGGRRFFSEAVDAFSGFKDPYRVTLRAQSYQRWADAERQFGDPKSAEWAATKAVNEVVVLAVEDPNRVMFERAMREDGWAAFVPQSEAHDAIAGSK